MDILEGVPNEDGGGRHWQPTVLTMDEVERSLVQQKEHLQQTKAAQRRDEEHKAVVAVLRSKPRGETTTQIQRLSGLSSRRPVGPAIMDLLELGHIVECQVKKPGRSKGGHLGYRLVKDPCNKEATAP